MEPDHREQRCHRPKAFDKQPDPNFEKGHFVLLLAAGAKTEGFSAVLFSLARPRRSMFPLISCDETMLTLNDIRNKCAIGSDMVLIKTLEGLPQKPLLVLTAAINSIREVIQVTNAYSCPDTDDKVKFHETLMQNVDEDGFKSFSGILQLPFDFIEEWEYQLRVDRLNNGYWQNDTYSREGNVCEDVKEFLPDAWKKIINSMEPPFESECFAHSGTYKINNLQISRHELKLPGVLYGIIRIITKLFDPTGEEVYCGVLEIKETF